MLVSSGAKLEACDLNGWTALFHAAVHDHYLVVVRLLACGCSAAHTDHDGRTILDVCADYCSQEILDILSLASKHAESQTSGNFPFHASFVHFLCAFGETPCIELLSGRAHLNVTDGEGNTPLHYAAEQGNVGALLTLCANGGDISLCNERGDSPLHVVSGGPAAQVLIDQGASPTLLNDQAQIPLHTIVGREDEGAFLSVAAVSNCNHLDVHGQSPWLLAVELGNLSLVTVLLGMEAAVESCNAQGQTALHCALLRGHWEIGEKLIMMGAPANAADQGGVTPVLLAALMGQCALWSLMVESGGHLDVSDSGGCGIAHYAAESLSLEMLQTVQAAGVTMDGLSTLHLSPLQYLLETTTTTTASTITSTTATTTAANNSSSSMLLACVDFLLQCGNDPNQRSRAGNTPFMVACAHPSACDLVPLLLQHGAQCHLRNHIGQTPLHLICENEQLDGSGRYTLAQSLLREDVTVSARADNGSTAMHRIVALFPREAKLVNLLVEAGCPVAALDGEGRSVVDLLAEVAAPSSETAAMEQVLRKHGLKLGMGLGQMRSGGGAAGALRTPSATEMEAPLSTWTTPSMGNPYSYQTAMHDQDQDHDFVVVPPSNHAHAQGGDMNLTAHPVHRGHMAPVAPEEEVLEALSQSDAVSSIYTDSDTDSSGLNGVMEQWKSQQEQEQSESQPEAMVEMAEMVERQAVERQSVNGSRSNPTGVEERAREQPVFAGTRVDTNHNHNNTPLSTPIPPPSAAVPEPSPYSAASVHGVRGSVAYQRYLEKYGSALDGSGKSALGSALLQSKRDQSGVGSHPTNSTPVPATASVTTSSTTTKMAKSAAASATTDMPIKKTTSNRPAPVQTPATDALMQAVFQSPALAYRPSLPEEAKYAAMGSLSSSSSLNPAGTVGAEGEEEVVPLSREEWELEREEISRRQLLEYRRAHGATS
jgi:ankyrin repeat protein